MWSTALQNAYLCNYESKKYLQREFAKESDACRSGQCRNMDVCMRISANGYIKRNIYHNSQPKKPVSVFCFHTEAVRKGLFHTLGKPFS